MIVLQQQILRNWNTTLYINNNNYLSWVLDAKMHLDAMNLENTIKEENATTSVKRKKKP